MIVNAPLEDAFVVSHAVVFGCSDGPRAKLCSDAQEADELALHYQRRGLRARVVTLEGEELLLHAD